MSSERINPIPMGTMAATGQLTPAMRATMAQAYGSRGGRASAAKRRASAPKKRRARKSNGGRKLKFGSPAWRKKYMKRGGKRRRK